MKKTCDWPELVKFSALRKLIRIMKLTTFLFFLSIGCVFASKTYSQTKTLNLKFHKTSVKEVLSEIEDQSEFYFMYNSKLIDVDREVSVNVKEQKVEQVLNTLFAETDVEYVIKDRFIVLTGSAVTQGDLRAQQQSVLTGKVSDENGEPLPGVTVVIKGTTQGTVTNLDGLYTLSGVSEKAILEFTFIGLKTQDIEVGTQTTINVTMFEDAVGIEEVVVIGYGTQKKVNLTSAVQMVDTKDLENRPVKSVAQMLSASVPGLNVTTGSSAPDAEPSLNIRGYTGFGETGSPLVLVDGVPQSISYVNANDVESISVLKDAAASAIYGSRAPNGVILITTKAGKKGEKMQINFNCDINISQPLGVPDMASSVEYANFVNEGRRNSLLSDIYTEEQIDRMQQYIDGDITTTNIIEDSGLYGGVYDFNANEDHFDRAFRDNVMNQKYSVSINGGGEKSSYYASLGHVTADGSYNSDIDWMKRYFSVIKVNTDITDWLSVGASSKYTREQSQRPTVWTSGQSDSKFFDALAFMPSVPSYNDNGSPNEFSIMPSIDGLAGSYNNTTDDLWLTGQIEFKPLKGLSIKGDYSWNVYHAFDFDTELVIDCWDADGSYLASRRSPSIDQITEKNTNKYYHTLNLLASYDLNVDKHSLNLMAGYNEEKNNYNSLTGSNTDFYTPSVLSLSTTYGENAYTDDVIYAWATRGWFGRMSYNYKETYLLDVNMRYDASSKYSEETRWAFFPSVSVGYNVAKENFWPLKQYVNMFKIKGSIGKLGNNSGDTYAYISTMSSYSETSVLLDGGKLPYVTMADLVSADLTWEKPRTIDFGVEIGAFKNRLHLEGDWYQRTTFDQEGPAEQYPEVLGATVPTSNNAVTETRGWEVSASWTDQAFKIKGSSVKYGIRAGISDYIGYVVDYETNETGLRSSYTRGERFGELYGYHSLGIAQTVEDVQSQNLWRTTKIYPGDLMLEDTNGDGLLNSGQGSYWYSQGDRHLLGYTYPRYKYNIALNASWKGLAISALFDGVGKQSKYISNQFVMLSKNLLTEEQLDRGWWSADNPDAFYTRPYNKSYLQTYETTANDKYDLNLAHLRIKNVNISYTVPASLVSRLKLRSLTVSLSGENLGFIYYKAWAKEYDPIQLQNSVKTYPPSRTYSIGFKLGI
jgi:TonB-linked SusC/RagA family outer membrane protein